MPSALVKTWFQGSEPKEAPERRLANTSVRDTGGDRLTGEQVFRSGPAMLSMDGLGNNRDVRTGETSRCATVPPASGSRRRWRLPIAGGQQDRSTLSLLPSGTASERRIEAVFREETSQNVAKCTVDRSEKP